MTPKYIGGKCLVVKNDGIGDLILTSGIIASLSKSFDSLDLVTCTANKEIAERIVGVNRIFYVSRDKLRYNRLFRKFNIYIRSKPNINDYMALKAIENCEYDYAIVLRRFIRASTFFIMERVNAKKRICMWRYPTNLNEKKAFKLTGEWERLYEDDNVINEIVFYKRILEKKFKFIIDGNPRLDIDTTKFDPINKSIGFSIGGQKGNWPDRFWCELAKILVNYGWEIVLFGGNDAIALSKKIQKICKDSCTNLVGKINLIDSTKYLKKVSAMIGNETGFTHFCSLFLSIIVVIYGGRTFGRFLPWPNSSNQYLIYKAMTCYDCNNNCKFLFKRFKCLKEIYPIDVFNYFNEIYENDKATNEHNLTEYKTEYSLYTGDSSQRVSNRLI